MIAVQTSDSGNTFLLAVAFFFRQWEAPSGSGNFLTSSGNALCILFPTPTASETVPAVLLVEPSTTKPNKDLSQSNRPSVPITEDWVSDSKDESEGEPMPTQKAPSFVQTSKHVKTPRPSVKPVEHPIPAENLRKVILKSRGHRHSWHRKACFVCKSLCDTREIFKF
nr:hypothetical protein [Tanacetum cinerariifolium]